VVVNLEKKVNRSFVRENQRRDTLKTTVIDWKFSSGGQIMMPTFPHDQPLFDVWRSTRGVSTSDPEVELLGHRFSPKV
jgi:uncharacterized protein (DUF608 family)